MYCESHDQEHDCTECEYWFDVQVDRWMEYEKLGER